jgi:very-short-patch-repair endonuclease
MYRLDLAFRERLLAVEYDGEWHAEGDQPERDAERRARLRKAGWEFVIVTKEQLYGDPRGMVCDVREAYFRRGGK